MILEVKQWPESQEVMDDDEWFFIMAGNAEEDPLGSSAYARIIADCIEEIKNFELKEKE